MLPPYTTREEFEALRKRAEPWRDGVRWICERHGLDGPPPALLPEGSNVVFASPTYVVKLIAPVWPREFEAERALLDAVEGRLGIPTPRLEAVGRLMGWGYLAMERLPGRCAGEAWAGVAAPDRARLVGELGAALARLHALSVPTLKALGPSWPALLEQQRACWETNLARCRAPAAWTAPARALVERQLGDLAASDTVPTHADVTYEHLLLESGASGWRATGLIDFADGTSAPPDYDLLGPCTHWFAGDAALQTSFLDGYGYPASLRTPERAERFLALALLHRFVDLPRAVAHLASPASVPFEALPDLLYPAFRR